MLPFASYVQRRYHRATGWNDDNRYSNLTLSAKGSSLALSFSRVLNFFAAILDFEVPRGLHFHVSKSPNSLFNTTYSLNALPSLHGSLGYIFTSCDLDIQSSANVKFRDVVSGFKIYDRPKPPELLGDETWLGGERVDIPRRKSPVLRS
jgi:distribution and morphology protein 10